jgi:hypothetical protein
MDIFKTFFKFIDYLFRPPEININGKRFLFLGDYLILIEEDKAPPQLKNVSTQTYTNLNDSELRKSKSEICYATWEIL